MALDYLNSNPGLWYPTPAQEAEEDPDNFWDWWEENGAGATGLANSVLCTTFPKREGCSPNVPTHGVYEQDNTLQYLILALLSILILILIFK